jgi:hypothetical protein
MNASQVQASLDSLPRTPRLILLLLVFVTFAAHLAIGVYYVTGPMSPFSGLTLGLHSEAFLNAYPGWNNREEFDDAAYNRAAVEVLNTGIPRDHTGSIFVYAPVYAYFVAFCYWLGGFRLLAIAIPQAMLAAFTCVAIALAAYRVSSRFKVAALLTAGFLFLINLRLAMYVGYVSPTILLGFFFALALLTASREFTTASLSRFVAALILAMGTQAGFFIVALAAAGWLFVRFLRTNQRQLFVAAGAIVIFVAGKVLLPSLLNENSAGSMNKIGQAVLWEANNPYYETMGPFSLWERRPGNPWTSWKMSSTETERYNEYLERAKHDSIHAALLWIRENPGQYAKLGFIRLWTTLGPFTGMMSPRNRLISFAIWLVTFPAGAYGWWVCRRIPVSGLAAAVGVSIILSSTFVIVEWYLRYRFPLDLVMTMFAGAGYSNLFAKGESRAPSDVEHA